MPAAYDSIAQGSPLLKHNLQNPWVLVIFFEQTVPFRGDEKGSCHYSFFFASMSRLFFHSFLSLRFRSRSSPCALTSSRRETVTCTFHLHYRQCEFISTRSPPNIPSFKDINGRGIKNTRGLPGINEGDSKSLSQNDSSKRFLQGEVLDFARDLRKIRPGDIIQVPYEVTITESVHDFWHSAFHSQDRITTSTPFSRKIGLQDRILPFSLVLFLTSSMTHADAAKVQVGYDNVIYHWPCFAGDTFTKIFQVLSVRNTSDGNHTVSVKPCSRTQCFAPWSMPLIDALLHSCNLNYLFFRLSASLVNLSINEDVFV